MEIFVIHDGEQFGPLSSEVAETHSKAVRLSLDDLAWIEGLPDW
jgi:hypothetical protein